MSRRRFKSLFIGIVATLLVLIGGGFVTYSWWQAMGTIGQQAFLTVVGVGLTNLCISLFILVLIIAVAVWASNH